MFLSGFQPSDFWKNLFISPASFFSHTLSHTLIVPLITWLVVEDDSDIKQFDSCAMVPNFSHIFAYTEKYNIYSTHWKRLKAIMITNTPEVSDSLSVFQILYLVFTTIPWDRCYYYLCYSWGNQSMASALKWLALKSQNQPVSDLPQLSSGSLAQRSACTCAVHDTAQTLLRLIMNTREWGRE